MRWLAMIVPLLWALTTAARQPEDHVLQAGKQMQTADSTAPLFAFKHGQVNGHLRYYFMATDNTGGLTDYYANALGGGLRYISASFHGFQAAAGFSAVFNAGSSDLSSAGPLTGQNSRYEAALFDITNPADKSPIYMLDALYLRYAWKASRFTFGKQLINTPFINPQDGRMRPTVVDGLYADIRAIKKVQLELAWLYGLSPRSTPKWYSTGASIGLYSRGVNPDGSRSGYAGQLHSKGIFMAGITYDVIPELRLKVWEQFTENIFNTVMLQADYSHPLQNGSSLIAGAQLVRQNAVKDGGHADPSMTYFSKGAQALIFGGRAGWKNDHWETTLNYTRITAEGRYLMPREWGHEPFFTFLSRERSDGLGDVHAIMGKVLYTPVAGLKTSLAFGCYRLPPADHYALNKYGLPSYNQLNADLHYTFGGWLQGLDLQLLYVYKDHQAAGYHEAKYYFNKTNVHLWSFVLNYRF